MSVEFFEPVLIFIIKYSILFYIMYRVVRLAVRKEIHASKSDQNKE